LARKKVKEEINYNVVNQKAASWCIKYGYRVYLRGVDKKAYNKRNNIFTTFKVVVQAGSKEKVSEETYSKIGASNRVWEIYQMLYDKHADK